MKSQNLMQGIAFTLIGASIAYWSSSASELPDKIAGMVGGAVGGFLGYLMYRWVSSKLNPPAKKAGNKKG